MVGMFIIMRLLGRTLNVPALAGIAFAVGMLVDNFIVVLENSFRHRSEGLGTLEATIKVPAKFGAPYSPVPWPIWPYLFLFCLFKIKRGSCSAILL